MEFYSNLYVSDSIKKRKNRIIRRLKAGKECMGCYVIVLTENPRNQLEFFDALFLLQHSEKQRSLFVVGLAGCYEEAVDIIRDLLEATYKHRRDARIREYILEQQGSYHS